MLSPRSSYFDASVAIMLLDLNSNIQTYIDSQILFVIAKHCFLKKRGVYSKIDMINDFNDFYVFINSRTYIEQSTTWFNLYSTQRMAYADRLDSFINNHYERVCITLTTYDTFDEIDDLYLFLTSKNNDVNSLNYIYAISLGSDPFNSDDEELVFRAEDIINDPQFSSKTLSSYCVLNGLKKITGIKTTSFYNFYTLDESISGEGDSVVNSLNYYDAAAAFKYMPRYIKLSWNPIQGGSGIDTTIVPVSGNISNISEVQILNEYYFSQTFRKDSNVISSAAPLVTLAPAGETTTAPVAPSAFIGFSGGSSSTTFAPTAPLSFAPITPYITICSSSLNKFSNSSFWNKITHEFQHRETKDVIDNMIFVTDHNLLRKRSDDPPKLQYVGYLIHKYEWHNDTWKLKEIIMLDDCRSSCYYDFNVLYGKKYQYKISSIIKWVYSTSLSEVESSYSMADFYDSMAPTITTDTPILPSDLVDSTTDTTDRTAAEMGSRIMGSAEEFIGRADILTGEILREEEESRAESRDILGSVSGEVSMAISKALSSRVGIRK
ncbi:MAG: hypothetical protein WC438_05605 [Candidatus Pacearchaeota archaeon]